MTIQRTSKRITLLLAVVLLTALSCQEDEPFVLIDYEKLLVGRWTETRATDAFSDLEEPFRSSQTDLTNTAYVLEFKENLKFELTENSILRDSGEYRLSSDKRFLYTTSMDNIRVPKLPADKRPLVFSTYQLTDITDKKLVLTARITTEASPGTGKLLRKRELIWELGR